jgi:hypothetical protein
MSCNTPARLTHYFGRCHLNHIKVKSSQVRGQIQKSQHRSRGRPRTQESRNLISDPNSWPYDPNMHF